MKDVARVEDAADVTVDYALIDGKRSVYIPVVKTADASTWTVVQDLKKKLPEMRTLLPADVKISYEFDQSVFVINAVKSLITEGGLRGIAHWTNGTPFLRDLRSSLIVVITIPVSIHDRCVIAQLIWPDDQYHDPKRPCIGNWNFSGPGDGDHRKYPPAPGNGQAKKTGYLRCIRRNIIPAPAYPTMYPGGICTFLYDEWRAGKAMFLPLSLSIGLYNDRFISIGANTGADLKQLDDKGRALFALSPRRKACPRW